MLLPVFYHPNYALCYCRWEALAAGERRFYQDQAQKLCKPEEEEVEPPRKKMKKKEVVGELDEEDDRASVTSVASTVKSSRSTSEVIKDVIGVFRREHACCVCEEVKSVSCPGDPVLKCKGQCQRAFHPGCLGPEEQEEAKVKAKAEGGWKCKECTKGAYLMP